MVFAESAIDALSYAALFPDGHARYRSIGGQVNDQQPGLIHTAILDLPDGAEVVAAMDNDRAGHALASLVEKAVEESGRSSLTYRRHHPASRESDWNDVLRQNHPSPSFPTVQL